MLSRMEETGGSLTEIDRKRELSFLFACCSLVLRPFKPISLRKQARYGVAIILCVTAMAPSEAAAKWGCLRTQNLEIIAHVKEDVAQDIAYQLELFRQLFSQALRPTHVRAAAVRVYLFETDRHFRSFKPLKDGKPALLSGFFQRDLDRDTIALELQNSRTAVSQLAFHLYAHILIGSRADRWPFWLTEGMAEFFSTARFGENKVRLGEAPKRHLSFFRENQPLSLSELFGATRYSRSYDEGDKSGPFYATAWLVTHKLFMNSEHGGWAGLAQLCDLLEKGGDRKSALAAAFQANPVSLEAKLGDYGRRFVFPTLEEDFMRTRIMVPLGFTPLAEPEILANLGDLLFRAGRLSEAEAFFNKAIVSRPQLPTAYEGLGFLHLRQGRRQEAALQFKEANDRGSKNALSHYYQAEMLLEELAKDSPNAELANVARSRLETAIRLRPDFAPGHHSLAHLPLMLGSGFEDGLPHAETALQLDPGNARYLLTLGRLQFYAKRFSEARASLELLLQSESKMENGLKTSVESFRELIEAYIRRKKELESMLERNPLLPATR